MKTNLILIFSCWSLFCSSLSAQDPKSFATTRPDQFGREMFLYQAYNFPDTSDMTKSRADFYFTFVNDILTFFKTEKNTYDAEYDISLIVYTNKNEALLEKSITDRLSVNTFEETNSRIKPIRQKISISLPPGQYHYSVQLTDSESRKILKRENTILLTSFSSDQLCLSDIVFINKIDSSAANTGYIPNLMNIFSTSKSAFAAYCELTPGKNTQELTVKFQIYSSLQQLIYQQEEEKQAARNLVPLLITFKDHITKPGEYNLIVEARTSLESVKKEKKFGVHWGNLSVQENNIDIALDQLRLIALPKDIERIISAVNPDERKTLYDEFWSLRDPDPLTPENELKDEFFRRLDLTNRTFTEVNSGREGWRTDRGHVYIKNGPPDEVERQSVELNQPTAEIWYYAKLNRRYIFSDRSGSGEFRLVRVE